MNDYGVRGNSLSGLVGATLGFFIGFAGVSLFGSTIKLFENVIGGALPFSGF